MSIFIVDSGVVYSFSSELNPHQLKKLLFYPYLLQHLIEMVFEYLNFYDHTSKIIFLLIVL